MSKPKTAEEQQLQEQQRMKLREQCSAGMQPGHFVLLSRQLGDAAKVLHSQRNKRKAAQAFDEAPMNGERLSLL